MAITVQFSTNGVDWTPNPSASCANGPTPSQAIPAAPDPAYGLIQATAPGDRLFVTAANAVSETDTVVIDPSVLATLGGNDPGDQGKYNTDPTAQQFIWFPMFKTDAGDLDLWGRYFHLSANPKPDSWRLRASLWFEDPSIPTSTAIMPPAIVLYDFDDQHIFVAGPFNLETLYFKGKTKFVRVDPGPGMQAGDRAALFPSLPENGNPPVYFGPDETIHPVPQSAAGVGFVDTNGKLL